MELEKSTKKRAAFYDVDGTLADSNIVSAYIYYILALPKLNERMIRFSRLLFASPLYSIAEKIGRKLFNRWFYSSYKDISYQMLKIMGRRVAQKAILPYIYPKAYQQLQKGEDMGLIQVLVTGSLDLVIEPLAKELGIKHYIANQLEYAHDKSTGKLRLPILSDEAKGDFVRDFAIKHNIDLTSSYAFGDAMSDLNMLEAVGFPCAVNPQRGLEKIAIERGWPILIFK